MTWVHVCLPGVAGIGAGAGAGAAAGAGALLYLVVLVLHVHTLGSCSVVKYGYVGLRTWMCTRPCDPSRDKHCEVHVGTCTSICTQDVSH